jgi:hypothetical protein
MENNKMDIELNACTQKWTLPPSVQQFSFVRPPVTMTVTLPPSIVPSESIQQMWSWAMSEIGVLCHKPNL